MYESKHLRQSFTREIIVSGGSVLLMSIDLSWWKWAYLSMRTVCIHVHMSSRLYIMSLEFGYFVSYACNSNIKTKRVYFFISTSNIWYNNAVRMQPYGSTNKSCAFSIRFTYRGCRWCKYVVIQKVTHIFIHVVEFLITSVKEIHVAEVPGLGYPWDSRNRKECKGDGKHPTCISSV